MWWHTPNFVFYTLKVFSVSFECVESVVYRQRCPQKCSPFPSQRSAGWEKSFTIFVHVIDYTSVKGEIDLHLLLSGGFRSLPFRSTNNKKTGSLKRNETHRFFFSIARIFHQDPPTVCNGGLPVPLFPFRRILLRLAAELLAVIRNPTSRSALPRMTYVRSAAFPFGVWWFCNASRRFHVIASVKVAAAVSEDATKTLEKTGSRQATMAFFVLE